MKNKLKTLTQVAKVAAAAKKEGKIVGLITGCFDVVYAASIFFVLLKNTVIWW